MKTVVKRFISGIMAAAMTASILCMNVGAVVYNDVEPWRIKYRTGAPTTGDLKSCDQCTIVSYGGGYRTYCYTISGANDRYVKVSAPGIGEFIITTTGYSLDKPNPIGAGNDITFTFFGHATGECNANGKVGPTNQNFA